MGLGETYRQEHWVPESAFNAWNTRAQSAAVDALYDAAFFARNRLLQDNYSDAETIDKLNRALKSVEELKEKA